MQVLAYIITDHPPLYEGDDQVAIATQTFIIPLHSFNTYNMHYLLGLNFK